MIVKLSMDLVKAIGKDEMKKFDITLDESRSWKKYEDINLAYHGVKKLKLLLELVRPFAEQSVKSAPTVLRDIETWTKVISDASSAVHPRNMQHFYSLLMEKLSRVPGHRLFRYDKNRGVRLCYYINEVQYQPKQTIQHGGVLPACVSMHLLWNEFGGRKSLTVTFEEEDIAGRSAIESLNKEGFMRETDDLRKVYLAELKRFESLVPKIGLQCLATGVATDDLDGNPKSERSWYWSRTNTIRLDKDDEPSRVVVDVFREGDNEREDRDCYLDQTFWKYHRRIRTDEDDVEEDLELDKIEEAREEIEIPIHPNVACFDMRRHLRLRIHVSQLKEYVYDSALGDKLVLPDESRQLVEMLLHHKGGFKDIIAGKGGGAVILCAGPPGTGKTLTAEVYSEVIQMPLYSVQCSQLGVSPDELENELMKVFARSQRWNAILLLDEADVYVASRGRDLIQNAIVGVFLRTLEYYKGVLFLTTNRADLVDDAVASRCVARIKYDVPTEKNQKRIWKILAQAVGVEGVTEAVIDKIVKRFPLLTGRDIKNLLKLMMLVMSASKKQASVELVEFVSRFKPTDEKKGESHE